jgi:hypothetical protein
MHLYQKDERALPGDLHSCKHSPVSPLLNVVSRKTHPLSLLSLSIFFDFEGLSTNKNYFNFKCCFVRLYEKKSFLGTTLYLQPFLRDNFLLTYTD